MRCLPVVLAACALAGPACADVMLTDSFEKPGRVKWQSTRGPVQITDERARENRQCVKETLEEKHGLSVYYVGLPVYPRTTCRASAWVYVP